VLVRQLMQRRAAAPLLVDHPHHGIDVIGGQRAIALFARILSADERISRFPALLVPSGRVD
jgi:hypothetical protein